MHNNYFSSYRGCAITARCSEVHTPTDMAALGVLPSIWSQRFVASFSVTPADSSADSWQRFPQDQFGTRNLAAKNALAEARHAIDISLAAA